MEKCLGARRTQREAPTRSNVWITRDGELILASHRARAVATTRWRLLEAGITPRRGFSGCKLSDSALVCEMLGAAW